MSFSRRLLLGATVLIVPCLQAADDKKEEKKETPKVTATLPFAITTGTNKVTIRGLLLTNATGIRFLSAPNLTAEIKSRGKATVPDKGDPKKLGDTQLEAQIILPDDFQPGDLPFVVSTAGGDTNTNLLRVVPPGELFDEKEPNPGFRKANVISLPQTVRGAIQDANDVDVFRFEGKAGQRILIQTHSVRYGSALDPLVSLLGSRGHTLKTIDDSENPDAQMTVTLQRDGAHFVVINDAHDRGGAIYPYLIQITFAP